MPVCEVWLTMFSIFWLPNPHFMPFDQYVILDFVSLKITCTWCSSIFCNNLSHFNLFILVLEAPIFILGFGFVEFMSRKSLPLFSLHTEILYQ